MGGAGGGLYQVAVAEDPYTGLPLYWCEGIISSPPEGHPLIGEVNYRVNWSASNWDLGGISFGEAPCVGVRDFSKDAHIISLWHVCRCISDFRSKQAAVRRVA